MTEKRFQKNVKVVVAAFKRLNDELRAAANAPGVTDADFLAQVQTTYESTLALLLDAMHMAMRLGVSAEDIKKSTLQTQQEMAAIHEAALRADCGCDECRAEKKEAN